MANTYSLIASNTLGTNTTTITFGSIPSTYDDLHLVYSARSTQAAATTRVNIRLNSISGTSYSYTQLTATTTTPSSARVSSFDAWRGEWASGDSATASTFGSAELYVPNYKGTTQKVGAAYSVAENNSAVANDWAVTVLAELANITSAITQIDLTLASGDFKTGSSFWLYGIKNS